MIKKTFLLLLVCISLFSVQKLSAQDNTRPIKAIVDSLEHTINAEVQKCMKTAQTNDQMVNCAAKAYELWDKELNKVYSELMSYLNDSDKELLKNSQRLWIKMRDSEFDFYDYYYWNAIHGTMAFTSTAAAKNSFVKQRVLDLLKLAQLKKEYKYYNHSK